MRRLLLLPALVFCLAGCAPKSKKSGPLKVSIFTELDVLTIMKEHLKDFSKKSGIDVEAVYIPYSNYSEKLVTQLSAGEAPDVIWIEASLFPQLHHAGAFQPLDGHLKKSKLSLKDFYPEVCARFSSGGVLYAVPQDTAPAACLYYNKTLFKELGIRTPGKDWTWKEFLEICRKVVRRDADGRTTRYAFTDNYGADWAGAIYANGGRLVDDVESPTRCVMDSPEAVEAVQFLADLVHQHKVSPKIGSQGNILALGQDEFMTGRMAMVRSGIWLTPTLRKIKDFEWDLLPFPRGPRAAKPGWPTGGSGYAISRTCARPDEAWKLIEFLTSEESQRTYAATGYVQPALIRLTLSDTFLKSTPPENKRFLHEAVRHAIYSPAHPRWREAETSIISVKLTDVWLGTRDAKSALVEITQKVNALLFPKP